jgi:DNA mismatch repair protein MSH2
MDDPILYVIELYDFMDNEQFSNLDSFLVQMGSCILYVSEEYQDIHKGDGKKINNLCEGRDIERVFSKKSLFTKKGGAEAIAKLCPTQTHFTNVAETERPLGYSCIDCLVTSLRLLDTSSNSNSDDSHLGKYDLRMGSLDNFMKLDSAAAEAVNLLPKPDHPSQFGSIFGVLNRCKTKMGSRLLERWLRQPLIDADEINARLDIVELLKLSTSARNQLYDGPLKGIPDLDQVVAKMQKKTAGLTEVMKLFSFTQVLPKILTVLGDLIDQSAVDAGRTSDPSPDSADGEEGEAEGHGGLNLPADRLEAITHTVRERFVGPFQNMSAKFDLYKQLINNVIVLNPGGDVVVNPAYSPELEELRNTQLELEEKAERLVKEANRSWASFTEAKLELCPKNGFVFRTTKGDDERQLRANNSSVRIISILKNGVHFTTPQLERIGDSHKDVEAEYQKAQQGIVGKVVETACTYLPLAEAAAGVVAELDVLASFATAAATSAGDYVRPVVRPRGAGILNLTKARHPCVEMMDGVDFIPNDYNLTRGESNFQLITGPNMGGKSTYIRGIGSIAVMAQVGSFVPCEAAELSVVDYVLARVGAGDAVQKGVSTFMAEMLEASVILETATRDSLIIIDELGRGTSTFDGFGIAWAISEYLVTKVDCMCVFATHFHELTALASQHPGVVNKHVSAYVRGADKRTAAPTADTTGAGLGGEVVMLYAVQDGPCTQSFGIHVAGTARFPKETIAEAKRKAAELEGTGVCHGGRTGEEEAEAKRQRVGASMRAFAGRTEESFAVAGANKTLRSELRALFPLPAPIAV